MKTMKVGEIARAIGGRLTRGTSETQISSVSTDTRTLKPGDLFIALRGENHDAHDYLGRAIEAGAGALIVEEYSGAGQVPVIEVEDTLKALQDLAAYNRQQFQVPVIGITGSSGKTTTKDMAASVLEQKYKVLKTEGNFNNEVGLPLTLLKMDEMHQVVVVEMAMRGPGEIDLLARIASPDGAVITNVGEAHIERLGSVENIARAKAELLDHIPEKGFAVLHRESPHLPELAFRCRGKVIFFGATGAGVYARDVRRERTGNRFTAVYYQEEAEIFVPVTGQHNVQNALAALAVGKQLGLSWKEIARGLEEAVFSSMRMEIKEAGGVTVINDAYNANPSSTKAALQALRETAGERRAVAVLGNMLELGSQAAGGHFRVGRAAVSCGVEYLFTVGDLAGEYIAGGAEQSGMPRGSIYRCSSNREALNKLINVLIPGDVVLVKGSRGMRMEEIVQGLIQNLTD